MDVSAVSTPRIQEGIESDQTEIGERTEIMEMSDEDRSTAHTIAERFTSMEEVGEEVKHETEDVDIDEENTDLPLSVEIHQGKDLNC